MFDTRNHLLLACGGERGGEKVPVRLCVAAESSLCGRGSDKDRAARTLRFEKESVVQVFL